MIKHRVQLLTSTPVELSQTAVIDPPVSISVQNIMNSGYAYIGGADVSTVNYGHKLYPRQSFTIELAPNDKLYAVGDSGVSVAIFTLEM